MLLIENIYRHVSRKSDAERRMILWSRLKFFSSLKLFVVINGLVLAGISINITYKKFINDGSVVRSIFEAANAD